MERTTALTLSRKPGEAVRIEGPARVQVVSDRQGRLRLRIEAAESVQIVREELLPNGGGSDG